MTKKWFFFILFFTNSLALADWNYNLSKYNISEIQIRGLYVKIELTESQKQNEALLSASSSDFLVLIKDKVLSIEDRRLLGDAKSDPGDLTEKTIHLKIEPKKIQIFSRKISMNLKNWKEELNVKAIGGALKFENTGRLNIDLQKGQVDGLKLHDEVIFSLGDVKTSFKQSELKGTLKQFKGSLSVDACSSCELKLQLNDVVTEVNEYDGQLKIVQNKSSSKYKKFKGGLRVESVEGSQDVQFEPGSTLRFENKKADLVFRAPSEKNLDLNLKTMAADLFVPAGYKITPEAQGAIFRLYLPGEVQKSSLRAESDQGRIVFKFKE